MITKKEKADAQQRAARMMRRAGIQISDGEIGILFNKAEAFY